MKVTDSREVIQGWLDRSGLAKSWTILEYTPGSHQIGEECSLEEDACRDIRLDLKAAIMNLAPMAPHEQISYVADRELTQDRKDAFWLEVVRGAHVSMELLLAAATMDIVYAEGSIRFGFTGLLPEILGNVDASEMGLPAAMSTEATFAIPRGESTEFFAECCCIALMETCALLAYALKLRECKTIYVQDGILRMKGNE